jgi:hypothetical protein
MTDDGIQDDVILDELMTENADADTVIRLDDNTVNKRETDILKAAKHVEEAINMREYCNWMIEQCKATKTFSKNCEKTITIIADYSQNGELPSYGNQQPGETYYYSPLTVNIFGIVDTDNEKETMVAYCYEEYEGGKGGNNVASLLMLHLHDKNLLNSNDPIGVLNIVMDNCSGQNKNKMVLRLANYLVEMGYFKEVNFCFLVVGHTKNHADRLFNLAKLSIRSTNVYCMKDFLFLISKNEHIHAVHVHADNFFEWGKYLDELYHNFDKPGVKKWQLFQCNSDLKVDGIYATTFKTSALDSAERATFIMEKSMSREKRSNLLSQLPKSMIAPGLREIKQVELYTKYRPLVPEQYWDELCPKPSDEVIGNIAKQRNEKQKARISKQINTNE